MSRANALQKRMKLPAVVHVAEVTEFVQHHVIGQMHRQRHQPQVQVDIAKGRAAAPVAHIVLDEYLIIYKARLFSRAFIL